MRWGFKELIRNQWRVYIIRALVLVALIWLLYPFCWPWIALVALEVLLWAMTYKTRAHESSIFRLAGDERLFEFVPCIKYRYYYPALNLWGTDREVPVSVGSDGMRVPENGSRIISEENRLLVLGDSATFGEGVSFYEAYPFIMERALNRQLDAEEHFSVLNAAVPGYNTMQSVVALRKRIAQIKPAAVILGVTLEDTLPWGRIKIGDDGEMMRLDAPFRHRLRETLKRCSYILYHFSQVYRFLRIDDYTRSTFDDGFGGFRRWRQAIADMADICSKHGALAIVVIVPGLWKLESGYPWKDIHARIRSVCEGEGIYVIDPLSAVEGMKSKTLWIHPVDLHPNAEAHQLIGEAVARELGPILEVRVQSGLPRAGCEP
ncbi:MAG: SGNH/GDSL hydrolase family protein [Candidatus Coatesbacteria bacterium]|nr:SGNH/GDSL hydrolase family protein [Candidatus Coatesbacteria bacterium]